MINGMSMESIMTQIKQEAKATALKNGAYSGYAIRNRLNEVKDKSKPVIISMTSPIYDEDYVIIDYHYTLVISDFVCDSWRGSYDLPAISYGVLPFSYTEIDTSLTKGRYGSVEAIIKNIEESDGYRVEGYKGGDFTLDMSDVVYIANYGDSNYSIAIVGIEEFEHYVLCYTKPDMY